MRSVYIAGCGLASALGPDLHSAMSCLRAGGVAPLRRTLTPELAWPYYRIADGGNNNDNVDDDWTARAQRIVRRVAAESGALAGPRDGPLFLASSSLDIGTREVSGDVAGDFPGFGDTVAAWLGWRGPVYSVSTACTSALNALMSAAALIGHGNAEHALVLGLELENRVTLGGFGAMQLLAPERALPYGAARNGLVLGEAVAALQLSSQPARWRVAGGANVVDGQDPAGTVASAVVAMCRQALVRSGLSATDIDLIKPQAAGSAVNDAVEAAALQQVFSPLPALVSLKAAIGHTLGAAGAAELALLMACIEHQVWPQVNYEQDTALHAPLAAQAPQRLRYLLASILGFGGGHAAVVLEHASS